MALGPNGRRSSRQATQAALHDYSEETTTTRSSSHDAEMVESFRRGRTNVRPYVRTSTQKLKWTHELHQCFMRAVENLGGQDKATPKKIQQLMKREGITIAHIKSHLQMYRSGKINAEGLSRSEYTTWQDGRWTSNSNASASEDVDSALALIQLREDSGRSNSDSGAGSPDSTFSRYVHKKRRAMNYTDMADAAAPSSSYNEPHPWAPSDTFLPHPVDVTDALSGSKRKAEEVSIELTMATRATPTFQFSSSPTPDEANLDLALS